MISLTSTIETVSIETLKEMRVNAQENFSWVVQAVETELESRILESILKQLRRDPSTRTLAHVNSALSLDYTEIFEAPIPLSKLVELRQRLKVMLG